MVLVVLGTLVVDEVRIESFDNAETVDPGPVAEAEGEIEAAIVSVADPVAIAGTIHFSLVEGDICGLLSDRDHYQKLEPRVGF